MVDETKDVLSQLYRAAVAAVDPRDSVRNNLSLSSGALIIGGVSYPLQDINNIYVLGAGKAAYGMATAVEEVLGELVTAGVIVTKDGHGGPLMHIECHEAAHPVPDGRGLMAAHRIISLAETAVAGDLVLCLFSGGASSLMPLPSKGITLPDKQAVTRLLLASGADIGELNCVRKHLSAIKGGRLASASYSADIVSLIISDVIGDDVSVIASGPTAPDETTYLQARDILKIRGVYDRAPSSVREHMELGAAGVLPESPKPDSEVFERVRNMVVASNVTALKKAEEVAGYLGYNAAILDHAIEGEAAEVGRLLAESVVRYRMDGGLKPACLLLGGEATVTVRGTGQGGRAQEMALSFAMNIAGDPDISALFAGTDGTDGPTDAAGAFVDGYTVTDARRLGLDPAAYLADNDTYNFFNATGGLFITGPTGTNVMDIGMILVR